MADNHSQTDAPKVFKIKRFQIGVNLLIQLITLLVILVMVNYLAFNHYWRWDFSRDQKYALSEPTKRLLHGLKKPVSMIVFLNPGSDIFPDIQNLLAEYQYASKKKITVETIDPYRNFTRARELQANYKFGATENVIILDYDGRSKFVNAADMAEYDNTGAMYGQPPRLVTFKGEQAITSGLLEITEETQQKIYVLAGHGEPELKNDTLKTLKTYVERQNIVLDTINLMNVEAVPPEVKTLLILGAKYDFSEREISLLKTYWDNKGRLFVALDPAVSTPRLTAFLNNQGIKPDNDRVLRTVNLGPVSGVIRDVSGVFTEGSRITKRLKGVNTMFLGATQSLTLDEPTAQASNIRLQPLIQAAEGYWGETEYSPTGGSTVYFDPKKDKGPPLTLAASLERSAPTDTRVQIDSGRMVVVANSDFINSDALTEANVDFVLSCFNWLLNREDLIGIAPKPTRAFSLSLSDDQLQSIAVLVLVAIPSIAAFLGIISWIKRRR